MDMATVMGINCRMATGSPTRARHRLLPAAVTACLMLSVPAVASAAELGAELSLAEVYTSNLRLLPDEFSESQWVTAIVPSVYVAYEGPRLEFDLDYELQALIYSGESDLNEAFSELWTTGIVDLIKDELFLRGFGRATQVNLNPEGRLSDNNINITENRSDAYAWELGPRWRRAIMGQSEIDAFYYAGRIDYDDSNTQGVDTQTARVIIGTNSSSGQAVSYQATYNYRNFDYDDTGSVKHQDIQLELGYATSPAFELLGIVGSESNIAKNNGSLDEPYWQAGFRSQIGKNELEALYGRRFYGPTFWLSWTRDMPNSRFRLIYRETQDTDESLAIADLGADTAAGLNPARDPSLTPDSSLVRPGSGDRSVIRRGIADYRWTRYRSEIGLHVFWVDREQISGLDPTFPAGSALTSTDQSIGAGFDLQWDIGVHLNTSLNGRWVSREFDTQQVGGDTEDDLYRLDWRLIYALGMKTELTFKAGYQTQTGGPLDYDEVHGAISIKRFFGGQDISRR